MAEMDVSDKGGGGGRKKLSTRVDLTPMVDLGFLLITFFMFTTTMSRPKSMPYNTPFKEDLTEEEKNKIKESTVITCLLSKDNKVYSYRGIGSAENPPELKQLTFKNGGEGSVREEFISFMNDVNQKKAAGLLNEKDNPMVLIKPDTNCTFDDLVRVMDEITINGIPSQATIDITNTDRDFMKQVEGKM